ncbi:MAG: hypothetical protein IIX89_05520 [Oscillospiraceae bacterium]|nr:hypothetical protein [Oscillospiraceae bacterium]
MPISQIMFCIDILSEALNTIGKSSYPNILFEQCLIRLASPFLAADNEALLRRIEKLEQRLTSVPTDFSPFSSTVASAPKAEAKPEIKPEVKAEVKPQIAPEVKKEESIEVPDFVASAGKAPFALWDKVLDSLSLSNPPLYGVLKQSKALIEGDIVYIDTNDFSFTILKGSESYRQSLKSTVAAVSGKPLKIAQYKENRPAASKSSAMDEILKRARRNGVDVSGE